MNAITETTLQALCRADETISAANIERAILVLKGAETQSEKTVSDVPEILTREQVAGKIHKGLRTVDQYCKRGVFIRVTFPGSSRASGILAQSVFDAIAAGATAPTAKRKRRQAARGFPAPVAGVQAAPVETKQTVVSD